MTRQGKGSQIVHMKETSNRIIIKPTLGRGPYKLSFRLGSHDPKKYVRKSELNLDSSDSCYDASAIIELDSNIIAILPLHKELYQGNLIPLRYQQYISDFLIKDIYSGSKLGVKDYFPSEFSQLEDSIKKFNQLTIIRGEYI